MVESIREKCFVKNNEKLNCILFVFRENAKNVGVGFEKIIEEMLGNGQLGVVHKMPYDLCVTY